MLSILFIILLLTKKLLLYPIYSVVRIAMQKIGLDLKVPSHKCGSCHNQLVLNACLR